ncbi:MAG TPA: phosphatidylserine decarboxylase, partial [Pirellulaceae bacterium]|nr:phosphatidylserine decarboxylase [Pirellulaceae bacterium]
TVQDAGCIGADTVMTVKGIDYRLDSLIPEAPVDRFLGGRFAVFFLSPSDCHRVYAPQTGTLEDVTHVPGYRLLVHPPYQRREFPVFTLNERVVLRMTTPFGACIVVMVAGWGVGHVTLPFDAEFRPRAPRITRRNYVDGHPMDRGDWLATFELGSTAILLLERADRTVPLVNPGDVVRFGQPAFGVVGASS